MASTHVFSVSVSCFIRFYLWTISCSVCLSLTCFTWHNILAVHPWCCKWQDFLLVHVWIQFHLLRLPWWLRQWRICLQCGRPGFSPWVGKIPWGGEWQPTPVFLPGEFHGQNSQTWVSELKKKKKNSICCPVTNRLPDVSLLETGLFGIKKIAICVSNHGEPQASLTGQGKEKAFIKKKRKLDSVNQASMAFHWLSSWLERRGVFTALGSAISTGLESSLSGFPVLFDWGYCLFIFYTLSIYMPHTHIWGHKESDLVFDTHIHTHGVTKSQT